MEPQQKLSNPADLWRKAYDEFNKESKGQKLLEKLEEQLSKSIKYKGESLDSEKGEHALMKYIDKASESVKPHDIAIVELGNKLKDLISAGASASPPASIAVAGLFMVSEIYSTYEKQKGAMLDCKSAVVNDLTARMAEVDSINPRPSETRKAIVNVREQLAANYVKFFKVVLDVTANLVIFLSRDKGWEKGLERTKNAFSYYAWDQKLADLKKANKDVKELHESLHRAREDETKAPQALLRPGWNSLHELADNGSLDQSHIDRYRPTYHLDAKTQGHHWTALMLTAKGGYRPAARTLLRNGANLGLVNTDGETCLHIAADRGRKSIVELLLKTRTYAWVCEIDPADSSCLTKDLATPVKGSAQGDTQGTKSYTKQSFVDQRNKRARTALSLAAEKGYAEIVLELLKAKANPSIGDADGLTPLMYAACRDRVKVLRKLREHSDKFYRLLRTQDHQGLTALHHAAKSDRYEAVKWLIKYDAPLEVRSKSGQKPKDMATGKSKELLESSNPKELAKK